MSNRIQITVDDSLMDIVKAQAAHMGLSVSSFSRLALKNALQRKTKKSLMDEAIEDTHSGNVEALSLTEFNRQIDGL